MLVGICGKKQSGKNTVANTLSKLFAEELNDSSWTHKAFAYKVKQILSILTGIPVEHMETENVKNSCLPKEWSKCFLQAESIEYGPFYSEKEAIDFVNKEKFKHFALKKKPITVRQALQWIDTDLFRDKFDDNTWINALFSNYSTGTYEASEMAFKEGMSPYEPIEPNWIITDVRFPNEAQAIKDRGGVIIKIERPFLNSLVSHSSETSIDYINEDMFDFTIYNDKGLEELYSKVNLVFNIIIRHFNLNK